MYVEISKAIERLYEIFSPYASGGMEYCKCGCMDEDEILKLHYAEWTTWQDKEVEAIRDFIRSEWVNRIHEEYWELDTSTLGVLGHFVEPKELFALWNITLNTRSLQNFVLFYYQYSNELGTKGIKISGRTYLINLEKILTPADLIPQLEQEFFNVSEKDPELAEKISIVITMLELSEPG